MSFEILLRFFSHSSPLLNWEHQAAEECFIPYLSVHSALHRTVQYMFPLVLVEWIWPRLPAFMYYNTLYFCEYCGCLCKPDRAPRPVRHGPIGFIVCLLSLVFWSFSPYRPKLMHRAAHHVTFSARRGG